MGKKKYLDDTGLSALLAKIKSKFADYALLEQLFGVQQEIANVIEGVASEVETNKTDISSLKNFKTSANLAIGLHTGAINDHEESIKSLYGKNKDNQLSISAIQKEIADYDTVKNRLGTAEKNIETAKTDHNNHLNRLGKYLGIDPLTMEILLTWNENRTATSYLYRNNTDIKEWPEVDMPKVENASGMFSGCTKLQSVKSLVMPSLQIALNMFNNCSSLSEINNIQLPLLEEAGAMFSGCSSLTSLSDLNLPACYDFRNFVARCSKLECITISTNASELKLYGMFSECTSLYVVNFICGAANDEAIAEDATCMFYKCSNLEIINIDGILAPKTGKLMFADCPNLDTINGDIEIGEVDWNNNPDAFAYMFRGCENLKKVTIRNLGGYYSAPFEVVWDFSPLKSWGTYSGHCGSFEPVDSLRNTILSISSSCNDRVQQKVIFHPDTMELMNNEGIAWEMLMDYGFSVVES